MAIKFTKEQFIEKAKIVHGNKFEYLSKYDGLNLIKVKIKCKIHNREFWQLPINHLRYNGCRLCVLNQQENLIDNILTNKGIKFERQKSFPDCKYKLPLRFDFYLPQHNICIEYDGIQHWKPIRGMDILIKQRIKDQIKDNYCKNNNIKLIRINSLHQIKKELNEIN